MILRLSDSTLNMVGIESIFVTSSKELAPLRQRLLCFHRGADAKKIEMKCS